MRDYFSYMLRCLLQQLLRKLFKAVQKKIPGNAGSFSVFVKLCYSSMLILLLCNRTAGARDRPRKASTWSGKQQKSLTESFRSAMSKSVHLDQCLFFIEYIFDCKIKKKTMLKIRNVQRSQSGNLVQPVNQRISVQEQFS